MLTAEATVAPSALYDWARAILVRVGASPDAADATAEMLVDANRRGLDSHGVVMLDFYLRRLRSGTTDGRAAPEVVIDLPAAAVVDGRNGLGAYIGSWSMQLCCAKAKQAGAAVVAVRNSSHFGAASFFAELAAREGCVGIGVSNSDPGMAPVGALGPILGTNPIAIAAPSADGVTLPSLDIATSIVAQGRIILAARAGEPIPESWAIGPDGKPTVDPVEALRGAVLPMAGHKGFALAFMIDVLAACLSGARLSPEIPGDPNSPDPQQTGHLFISIDVGQFGPVAEFEASLQRLADSVHSAPRTAGTEPFMIPGEREALTASSRATAIPFDGASVELLQLLGTEFGVPAPFEA